MAKLSAMGGGIKVSSDDVFQIGDIKQSLLTVSEFGQIHSDKWVPMDGRDVTGSKYAEITGKTTLPDIAGKFLRAAGGSAAPLGTTQGYATSSNNLVGATNNTGSHNHNTNNAGPTPHL